MEIKNSNFAEKIKGLSPYRSIEKDHNRCTPISARFNLTQENIWEKSARNNDDFFDFQLRNFEDKCGDYEIRETFVKKDLNIDLNKIQADKQGLNR